MLLIRAPRMNRRSTGCSRGRGRSARRSGRTGRTPRRRCRGATRRRHGWRTRSGPARSRTTRAAARSVRAATGPAPSRARHRPGRGTGRAARSVVAGPAFRVVTGRVPGVRVPAGHRPAVAVGGDLVQEPGGGCGDAAPVPVGSGTLHPVGPPRYGRGGAPGTSPTLAGPVGIGAAAGCWSALNPAPRSSTSATGVAAVMTAAFTTPAPACGRTGGLLVGWPSTTQLNRPGPTAGPTRRQPNADRIDPVEKATPSTSIHYS